MRCQQDSQMYLYSHSGRELTDYMGRLKKAIDNPAVEVVQCKTVEELVRNIIRNCKGEVIL